VDFPELVKVTDRASALQAIHLITHQGEGIDEDREDCHFGIFRDIRKSYLTALAEAVNTDTVFEPVRPSISNPVAKPALHLSAGAANPISEPWTAEAADCFDSVYGIMLRMLQYVFDNGTSHDALLRQFGKASIEMMVAVVKPLAESLTLMPAGRDYEHQTAGPGFVLSRHVGLPNEPRAAAIVAEEKLAELADRLDRIAGMGPGPAQLRNASDNLRRIHEGLVAFIRRELPGEG
jgi:hypothetical protein